MTRWERLPKLKLPKSGLVTSSYGLTETHGLIGISHGLVDTSLVETDDCRRNGFFLEPFSFTIPLSFSIAEKRRQGH